MEQLPPRETFTFIADAACVFASGSGEVWRALCSQSTTTIVDRARLNERDGTLSRGSPSRSSNGKSESMLVGQVYLRIHLRNAAIRLVLSSNVRHGRCRSSALLFDRFQSISWRGQHIERCLLSFPACSYFTFELK